MNTIATEELLQTVEEASDRLSLLTDEEAAVKPAPGKWSRKEILGHLLDSASNNHQRFVRAQAAEEVALAPYAQNEWVEAQGYAERPWLELVEFWRLYNRHLAHLIARIPAAALGHRCRIGDKDPLTLPALYQSYVEHLLHHLGQL